MIWRLFLTIMAGYALVTMFKEINQYPIGIFNRVVLAALIVKTALDIVLMYRSELMNDKP